MRAYSVANVPPTDIGAELNDFAGKISAGDHGKRRRQARGTSQNHWIKAI